MLPQPGWPGLELSLVLAAYCKGNHLKRPVGVSPVGVGGLYVLLALLPLGRDPEIGQVASKAPLDLSGKSQGSRWLVSLFMVPECSELWATLCARHGHSLLPMLWAQEGAETPWTGTGTFLRTNTGVLGFVLAHVKEFLQN